MQYRYTGLFAILIAWILVPGVAAALMSEMCPFLSVHRPGSQKHMER